MWAATADSYCPSRAGKLPKQNMMKSHERWDGNSVEYFNFLCRIKFDLPVRTFALPLASERVRRAEGGGGGLGRALFGSVYSTLFLFLLFLLLLLDRPTYADFEIQCGASPHSLCFVLFSFRSSGSQLGCTLSAVSAQRRVENAKNALQNIAYEGTPHSVLELCNPALLRCPSFSLPWPWK